MIVSETKIPGAFLVRAQPLEDERGFFARTFCVQELANHRIDPRVVQRSASWNRSRGTLRGMHYQASSHGENKIVSCSRGSIHDVIVDLRPASPRYRDWLAVTLTADSLDSLFIPVGCAHGFLTLEDETMVRYDISEFHAPAFARGFRFDDQAFQILWPFAPILVSDRDLAFPPFSG